MREICTEESQDVLNKDFDVIVFEETATNFPKSS